MRRIYDLSSTVSRLSCMKCWVEEAVYAQSTVYGKCSLPEDHFYKVIRWSVTSWVSTPASRYHSIPWLKRIFCGNLLRWYSFHSLQQPIGFPVSEVPVIIWRSIYRMGLVHCLSSLIDTTCNKLICVTDPISCWRLRIVTTCRWSMYWTKSTNS